MKLRKQRSAFLLSIANLIAVLCFFTLHCLSPSNEALARKENKRSSGLLSAKVKAIFTDESGKRTYHLRDSVKKAVEERLETIVESMWTPGDPPYVINILNTSDVDAYITGLGEISVSIGLINSLDNDHQLAGVIAHEMEHASTFDSLPLGSFDRKVQQQREEFITADRGGMKRMSKAGYDPREYRSIMVQIGKDSPNATALSKILGSHGDDGVRITSIDSWLSENELTIPKALKNKKQKSKEFRKLKRLIPKRVKRKRRSKEKKEIPLKEPKPFEIRVRKGQDKTHRMRDVFNLVVSHQNFKALKPEDQFKYIGVAYEYFDWVVGSYALEELPKNARNFFDFKSELGFRGFVFDGRDRKHGDVHIVNKFVDDFKKSGVVPLKHSRKDIQLGIDYFLELAKKFPYLNSGDPTKGMMEIKNLNKMAREPLTFGELLKIEDTLFPRNKNRTITTDNFNQFRDSQMHRAILVRIKTAKTDRDLLDIERLISNSWDINHFPDSIMRKYLKIAPKVFEAKLRLERTNLLFQSNILSFSPDLITPRPDDHNDSVWRDSSIPESKKDTRLLQSVDRMYQKELRGRRLNTVERFALARRIDQSRDSLHEILNNEIHSPNQWLNLFDEYEKLRKSSQGYADREWHQPFLIKSIEDRKNWKWEAHHIERLAKSESFWNNSDYQRYHMSQGVVTFAPQDESQTLAKREIERLGGEIPSKGLARNYRGYYGPAYEYYSSKNRNFQKLLYSKFLSTNPSKRYTEDHHKALNALLSRGTSEYFDNEAHDLYLNKNFKCAHCILEALDSVKIWDVAVRQEMYFKYKKLTKHTAKFQSYDSRERIVQIMEEIKRVAKMFPEESLGRNQVLETFANEIKANHIETRIIEYSKYGKNANHEGAAIRFMSGFYTNLRLPKSHYDGTEVMHQDPIDRQIQFIEFLQGKGPPPADMKARIEHFGEKRLLRQFSALPPNLKALAINPILSPPSGIYQNKKAKERLINLTVQGVEGYQKEARLLLESMLYGLSKSAPFQETLAMAYMLGQGDVKDSTPAKKMKIILQSLGNSGVSIGQKLRQRRLLPPEFYKELEDLQDQARNPSRFSIFEMIAKVMDNPNVDQILNIEEKLGDASSKIVVQVRYKDGRIGHLEDRALKILWENFDRSIEVETEKLSHAMDYLESRGGSKYRKVRSAVEAVQRGLLLQADARVEKEHRPKIVQLYESGKTQTSGYVFNVIDQDPKAGSSKQHVNDFLAKGKRLKHLSPKERAGVWSAIYAKDKSILFAKPDSEGLIYFEKDRHFGNYIAETTVNPPKIHVFDYAQTSSITEKRRTALFKLMGLIDESRTRKGDLPRPLTRSIADIVESELIANTKRKKASRRLISRIHKMIVENRTQSESIDLLFQVLSEAETQKRKVHTSVYDYLEALGNLEPYGEYEKQVKGKSDFFHTVEQSVRNSLDGFKPRFTTLEKCFLSILSKDK